jgi:hypothetical protein
MPNNVAAEIKSPATAKPLETPPILPPATKKSAALAILFEARRVKQTVNRITAEKKNALILFILFLSALDT